MKFYQQKWCILLVLMLQLCSCSEPSKTESVSTAADTQIALKHCVTNAGSYVIGDAVSFSVDIENLAQTATKIKKVRAQVRNISKMGGFINSILLKDEIDLKSAGNYSIAALPIWKIAAGSENDAYGVYISYEDENGKGYTKYATFFRVVNNSLLTCYKIEKNTWQGVTIFRLDGGMSAEYVVEKSLENLGNGIAQSWEVNAPGSGPNPVYATPQFLQKSVETTVNVYNDVLGVNSNIETVILSTGIPSMPNLSNVLKAPILPLHFLTSSNTVKEIQSILDYSNENGFSSYATLGYDLSVPTAVAWIKLLDIPQAYSDFIAQHHVKNIIIMGGTGTTGGETKAKPVLNTSRELYQAGSLYILYAGNTPNDIATMQDKIKDFNETEQQPDYIHISDWESGIISKQINNITSSVKNKNAGQNVYSITSDNLINLYDLGTYATLAYFKKNNITPTGVAINPYLLTHPVYESWKGFIPLHYWQLNPPASTIGRITGTVKDAIASCFPAISFDQLTYWVNSSNNFGAAGAAQNLILALQSAGLTNIRQNDYTQDEVWNTTNGMNAPCEKIAIEVAAHPQMFSWNQGLLPLTITDLQDVSKKATGILITKE